MGKWTTIAEAAIEVLAKRKGGALPDTTLPIRPARENLRTVVDSNTIGGRVSGDEMVPIDSLSGGPSLSARGQKAVDDIVEQMSGPDGFIERLIVDQDNNVIEGAHRVEALRRLGIEQVPITRVIDPTANLDLPKMGEAIKAVGPIHSDHVNQITAQVGDMLAEVGGDPAKVLQEFDLPKGFERFFRAALDSVSPKTLPTDEASRMARAREMGFDVDAYHGTGSDIREFDPKKIGSNWGYDKEGFFFTGDPSDIPGGASSYAEYQTGGNVMPVKLRMKSPYTLEDYARDVGTDVKNLLFYGGDEQPVISLFDQNREEIVSLAKKAGKDSISFQYGSPDNSMHVIFDPKNIRSRFAKFDPAKADSADILAGLGVVGAGAALSQQDGFDYGALRNVAEESNGQRSN